MSQVIPEKPLRVVVWSTGTIGRHAIYFLDTATVGSASPEAALTE